jgi:prophage DNA circulation protein
MLKRDAEEAAPIVYAVLDELLAWTTASGPKGANIRSAVGKLRSQTPVLLRDNTIAAPLIQCFDLARGSGITLSQVDRVRVVAAAQSAVSVGAIMTRDTIIEMCCATMGLIIAATRFTSRDDVDATKTMVNAAFDDIEETVADAMDAMTWRALAKVRAAIVMHLYETARPLPRMLNFRFNFPMPTLVMAHKLYADASRADELRLENKCVHPGFCRPYGRALSA